MPGADWWGVLWPHPEQVLANLGVGPDMEVVDLCCGDALFAAPLAMMVRHVVAIDLDPEMVERARAKIGAAADNCELVEGDAYAVEDLVRRSADFVLLANTFHGVPEKKRLAAAVAAILKPGGRRNHQLAPIAASEETTVLGQPRWPKIEMRMTPSELAAAVEPAGLKLTRVIELHPYHYASLFDKAAAS
jgi:ubiquinone/menaquinone biosynthesis C-methylase UbiE